MIRVVALLWAATALLGCSLWNAPDPRLLDGGDGGLDAGMPDAPSDVGVDAPIDAPLDSPDAPSFPDHETDCDDTMDEDMDGAVDCVDTDCASDIIACCREGTSTPLFTTTWCPPPAFPAITTDWRSATGTMATAGPMPACTVGSLGAGPNALIHRTCLPLAGGITISAVIDWAGACPTCEAMVALTPVEDATSGGLIEDLAVRVHEVEGRLVLDLTRAGDVLARFPDAPATLGAEPFTVSLDLYPSVVDSRPTLAARATVLDGPVTGSITAEETVAFPDDLLGPAQGCGVAPGLYLGLQTRGAPRFGEVRVIPAQCPNPNYFRPAGTSGLRWLDAETLGFEPVLPEHEWTEGGIGGASVVVLDDGPSTSWYYFFDGSNLNRANERDRDLDFSFGGAWALEPGLDTFELWGDEPGAPMAGNDAPTCVPPDTSCGGIDYREPVVVPSASAVIWVERTRTGTRLVRSPVFFEPGAMPLAAPTPLTIPSCESPSHPAVLTQGTSHVLVFVCGDDIRAMRLGTGLAPMGEPVVLIDADALRFPLGLVDVDGTISVNGPVATYRLWVAGRDALGLTRLAIAEGGVATDTAEAWPEMRPFAGNPVFSASEALLQDECDGVCTITGVGVARLPGTSTVRVVLSVTDEDDGAVRHALVPLEQTLR